VCNWKTLPVGGTDGLPSPCDVLRRAAKGLNPAAVIARATMAQLCCDFSCLLNDEVSGLSQPPRTLDLPLSESAGSHSLPSKTLHTLWRESSR
jgi:hypothetical protein